MAVIVNENECAGVVIVDLSSDDIGAEKPFIAAIRKSIRIKINPGPDYSIQGQELPPGEIRADNMNLERSQR